MEQKKSREEIQALGDNYCFACGAKNPYGLHLQLQIEGERYVAEKTLSREYQSYSGVVHGGIVTTMLDEAMGGYLVACGEKALTARIDVRYRKPTPVGEKLAIAAWIESKRGNFVTMKSTITLPDGTISAEGTATMAVVE